MKYCLVTILYCLGLTELILNSCSEFRRILEDPVNQILSPHNARLSRSRPGFEPGRDRFPGWGFFLFCFFLFCFSSPVRQMSGSFRPPRFPNIIWPSLSSFIIHYGRQWPEMLTRPKTLNVHTLSSPPRWGPLELLGYFKFCSDAKERVGCGEQREATAPIHP